MKINRKYFIILIFFIFWGIIGLSMTTGLWETKMQGPNVDDKIAKEDIKGWMKFKAIKKLFNVPLNYVYTELNLPSDIDTHRSIKELKEKHGFQIEKLREIIINYRHNKE